MGSACYLELSCSTCGKVTGEFSSKKSGVVLTGIDVNRHLVTAATVNGFSFTQMKRFCSVMNMPKPMSESVWYEYKRTLHRGAQRAVDKHLFAAAEQVRETYTSMHLNDPDDDGVLDISISIDVSWCLLY